MKTRLYQFALTFSLLVVFNLQLYSRVLTVSTQATPAVAEFSTLKSAHDAAQNGDTIYVYPSLTSYTATTIIKKLTIVGAGFNKVTDYSDCSKIAGSDTLKFEVGSEGSLISSLAGNFKIIIKANNIVIQRCKLSAIKIFDNLSNIIITDCLINTRYYSPNEGAAILISANSFVSICNNITIGSNGVITIMQNGSAEIKNNIIFGYSYSIMCYNSKDVLVKNNISISSYGFSLASATSAIIQNSPNLKTIDNDGNLTDKSWFIDDVNGNYHLKAGSPGIGAGTNGTDLGIYAGDYSTPHS